MAATDARALVQKATLQRFYFPLDDPPGTPLTADTGLDSERSIDGAAFADCTNETTLVEAGKNGFYLEVTALELTSDHTTVQVKNSGGTVLLHMELDPWDSADGNALIPSNAILMNSLTANAEVNAQCDTAISDAALATAANLATVDTVVDAIKAVTDLLIAARAEPSGVPAANEVWLTKLDFLFATLRNRLVVTATEKKLYDDSDNVLWKKTLTSTAGASGTYSEGEAESP